MDTAQAIIDDRFGLSTVVTNMSLEGCDEVDMTGFSVGHHEEHVVMTNNNDSICNNNADEAEDSVAELSDANSSPTSGKKENSGSKFPKEKGKTTFVGVRQRPSGRWVAEIKDSTQKIRLWLGTYDTPDDAARAYDDAARTLRGANTCTNFSLSEGGQPEIKSKAIRLLLQRAAVANRHLTTSEHHTTYLDGTKSSCQHVLQPQQAQPLCALPEEGDLFLLHNGTVVNFSLETDRPDSSHSSAIRNSSAGRGAQHHHHHRPTGAAHQHQTAQSWDRLQKRSLSKPPLKCVSNYLLNAVQTLKIVTVECSLDHHPLANRALMERQARPIRQDSCMWVPVRVYLEEANCI